MQRANYVPVLLTVERAERISAALAEAGASRLAGVAALPGDPLGIESRVIGSTWCDRVTSDVGHYHYFCGPRRAPRLEDVAEVVDWYRGRPLYARLSPFEADETLLRALAHAGLRQTSFMSVRAGPTAGQDPHPDVVIDPHAFAELWTSDPELRKLVEAEFSQSWRCYVARVAGVPAAYGALYITSDGVGVCAAAATVPEYRGRGLQTALLRTRIAEADRVGCDLVVAQASPGSTSERNMHRLGLSLAYTSVVWTR